MLKKVFGAAAYLLISNLSYAQQRADLRTTRTGPSQLQVGISAAYNVTIYSKGQVAMPGSYTTIYLPSGAFVPAKPSNCSMLSGYRMKCTLGTLAALGNAVPAATLAFSVVPAAPQNWALKAESKGTLVDYTPADSVATINLTVSAPIYNPINIVAPQNVRFDGCTFQGPPNPADTFALCGTSSLWGHDGVFAVGAYTVQGESVGNWSQNDPESLRIEFQDDGQPVSAIYVGTSISPTCFQGTGTFPNNSNYHSAFRACLVP
jgi:hypothetical protein